MIVTDNDGTILEWSAGAEKLLGWSEADAVGQSVFMIYTPEDRETGAAKAELDAAKAQGRSSDVRWHERQDGTTVFCDGIVSLLRDTDGTPIGYGKIMRAAYASKSVTAGEDVGTDSVHSWRRCSKA